MDQELQIANHGGASASHEGHFGSKDVAHDQLLILSYSVRAATSFADLSMVLGPKDPSSSVCWFLSHRIDAKTNKSLVGPVIAAWLGHASAAFTLSVYAHSQEDALLEAANSFDQLQKRRKST